MLPRRVHLTTRHSVFGHAHLSQGVADNVCGNANLNSQLETHPRVEEEPEAAGSPPAVIPKQGIDVRLDAVFP